MKKIKNILKSKRGIALENAILFLITTFTLCALLTTFTLIGRYQSNIENTVLKRKVAVEQIGEDFVAGKLKATDAYDNYSYVKSTEGNKEILKVFHESNTSKILLYVELSVNEGAVIVTKWQYNPSVDPSESNSNTTSTAATTVTATTTATTVTTQTTTAVATTTASST
ncbi:MAG: hypothetical protein IJX27_09385 [Clostridia bacterium]|nr:hypothetical protein [Clostridia bacterium]